MGFYSCFHDTKVRRTALCVNRLHHSRHLADIFMVDILRVARVLLTWQENLGKRRMHPTTKRMVGTAAKVFDEGQTPALWNVASHLRSWGKTHTCVAGTLDILGLPIGMKVWMFTFFAEQELEKDRGLGGHGHSWTSASEFWHSQRPPFRIN